jgi:hypothetical protein
MKLCSPKIVKKKFRMIHRSCPYGIVFSPVKVNPTFQ